MPLYLFCFHTPTSDSHLCSFSFTYFFYTNPSSLDFLSSLLLHSLFSSECVLTSIHLTYASSLAFTHTVLFIYSTVIFLLLAFFFSSHTFVSSFSPHTCMYPLSLSLNAHAHHSFSSHVDVSTLMWCIWYCKVNEESGRMQDLMLWQKEP